MQTGSKLKAGQWVEVLSKEEILATLDKNGQLDGLPFMPQMFQSCGKRYQVFKRAHKTCDTINLTGGRRMPNAVHLEGSRCDGAAYGGCQTLCLIFWKEAWLKPVTGPSPAKQSGGDGSARKDQMPGPGCCSEADVWAGTRVKDENAANEPVYVCQATQLPSATTLLPWWEFSQYVEDYRSGNATPGRLLRGFLYSAYYSLIQSGLGLGPFLRWFYDVLQSVWGGIPYPRKRGTIPVSAPTPTGTLNLQPGELVRVKSHQEILATLNTDGKNRGLYFDAESVPFCGGTYRVLKRVSKIVDEKTGKMMQFKSESVILEDVYCQARYSTCRMFCPRAIYPYWREIWLERAEKAPEPAEAKPTVRGELGRVSIVEVRKARENLLELF
jgi:hypothetical protein